MSVIEETAVATPYASTSTGADDHPAINDEFRSLLTELADARAKAEERNRQTSTFQQISSSLGDITTNLEGFFDPSVNLYARLNHTARLFSETTGARTQLLSTLQELSASVPTLAAGLVKDLFAVQSSLSNALQNVRTSSVQVVYMKIAFFQLSFQAQMSSYLGSLSGNSNSFAASGSDYGSYETSPTTRFGQMSLQLQMQEVATSYLQTDSSSLNLSLMMKGSYFGADLLLAAMDPVVLDLGGNGVDLKPVEDGVLFDLTGDGNEVRCGFVTGDDALLFLDENGDGVCTSGTELFGNQQGDANGFAELAKYDGNTDGEVNYNDNIYQDLRVWNDNNGDGTCEKDEVRTLQEAGVASIGVSYDNAVSYSGGNEIAQTGFFRTLEGKLRTAVDANFNYYTA